MYLLLLWSCKCSHALGGAGGLSQGAKGQRSASKKQKTEGQTSRKASAKGGSHGPGKPVQRASPAATEQATPPYDKLEGINDTALPADQKVPPLHHSLYHRLQHSPARYMQAFQREQEPS